MYKIECKKQYYCTLRRTVFCTKCKYNSKHCGRSADYYRPKQLQKAKGDKPSENI